jgi:hypothetical protein
MPMRTKLALALWLALAPVTALAQGSDLSNPQTDASKLTTGALLAARMPALTGNCATSVGAVATTCKIVLFFGTPTAPTVQNTTILIGPSGVDGSGGLGSAFVIPGACSLTRIVLQSGSTPAAGQTFTVTLNKNSVSQSGSITATISNGSFSATAAGTVAAVDGDVVAVSVTGSATSGNSQFRGYVSGTCTS